MSEASNLQRAFWTFLGYTLAGPFFAALALATISILAPVLGLGGLLPNDLPGVGETATVTFIWSVLPAALAAVIVIPMVLNRGQFGWIEAAAAGVVAFAAVVAFSNMPHREYLPALGFLAGLVSLGVRSALISGNILKSSS